MIFLNKFKKLFKNLRIPVYFLFFLIRAENERTKDWIPCRSSTDVSVQYVWLKISRRGGWSSAVLFVVSVISFIRYLNLKISVTIKGVSLSLSVPLPTRTGPIGWTQVTLFCPKNLCTLCRHFKGYKGKVNLLYDPDTKLGQYAAS